MKTIALVLLIFTMLTSASAKAQKKGRTTASSAASEKNLVDVDLGGSTGIYDGKTYQEIHLGVNINFTDWLTWRNSAFKRTGSNSTDVTGLDSTLRLILRSNFDGGQFRLFVGPGYRWADPSENNAVVGEAGVGITVGRFSLNAGAKYLQYEKPRTDSVGNILKRDDVNYFVNIGGGVGFGF